MSFPADKMRHPPLFFTFGGRRLSRIRSAKYGCLPCPGRQAYTTGGRSPSVRSRPGEVGAAALRIRSRPCYERMAGATLRHDRSDPDPRGDRARRPTGRRAAPSTGLRRAAQLAADKLAREASGQTLDATALVHEAYLRLVGHDDSRRWNSRGHFYAAAARAMRLILLDNAPPQASPEARRRPPAAATRCSGSAGY